jgi:high-affinity iron transporter
MKWSGSQSTARTVFTEEPKTGLQRCTAPTFRKSRAKASSDGRRGKRSFRLSQAMLFSAVLLTVGLLGRYRWPLLSLNPCLLFPSAHSWVSVLDISVLVFREGLECILVLAAITASLNGSGRRYQRPIAAGAGIAFAATILTWCAAVSIINDLSKSIPALDVQAATGLLAVVVLVVVMNWFFHRVYWTGWISMHNRKKRELLRNEDNQSARRLLWGARIYVALSGRF